MTFWQCYYHIVWATKYRESCITAQVEPIIFDSIRRNSTKLESPIIAINGVSDHIHIAVSIPPKLAISEWARQVKGRSAHEVGEISPDTLSDFRWQKGYGVVTFGMKNLDYVVAYINRQKEHHAANTTVPFLERVDEYKK